MKIKIIRIESHIVTCELEGGTLIDISKKWLSNNIKENDIIEFDVTEKSKIVKNRERFSTVPLNYI